MSQCNYISSDKLVELFDKGERSINCSLQFASSKLRAKIEENPSLIMLPKINYNQSNKYASLLKSTASRMNSKPSLPEVE